MKRSRGRNLVDRNMPDVLMVRLSSEQVSEMAGKRTNWIRVDVRDWKRKIARAINRRPR